MHTSIQGHPYPRQKPLANTSEKLGRATQGVTLIALDDGSQLSGLQRIVEKPDTPGFRGMVLKVPHLLRIVE